MLAPAWSGVFASVAHNRLPLGNHRYLCGDDRESAIIDGVIPKNLQPYDERNEIPADHVPSLRGYRYGCKCRGCKDAASADAQRYRAEAERKASLGLVLVPHGRTRGYSYYRCVCPDCKLISKAAKWYMRNRDLVVEAIGRRAQPSRVLRASQGYLVCCCNTAFDGPELTDEMKDALKHFRDCEAALTILFSYP